MNRAEAAWQNRPSVLMIGPMAPAVGGMATVIEQLLAGPLARECTFVSRSANPVHGTGTPRWRLWRSVRRHLSQIMGLMRELRRNAIDVVHIHTCSGFTFYRNLVDAAVALCCGVPVALNIPTALIPLPSLPAPAPPAPASRCTWCRFPVRTALAVG